MTNTEKVDYVGKFGKELLKRLREALPECCDVIPEESEVAMIHGKLEDHSQMKWITVSEDPGWNGVYAWCSGLPISHVDANFAAADDAEKREEILRKAHEVIDKLLDEYPHVDLHKSTESDKDGFSLSPIYISDFLNGGWINGLSWCVGGTPPPGAKIIEGYQQVVFDPEGFGWRD